MEVRGEVYFPLSGFRALQRASRSRHGEEARAEPAQRRGRLAAAARTRGSRPTRPLAVWVYGTGYREGVAPDTHFETLAWLREHGFRTNPFAERLESIEEVAEALRASGSGAAPSSTTRSTGS